MQEFVRQYCASRKEDRVLDLTFVTYIPETSGQSLPTSIPSATIVGWTTTACFVSG